MEQKIKLSAMMAVYNEKDFIESSILSCLPHVDNLIIIEGAYEEIVKLGKNPHSTDGTIQIIEKYRNNPKVHIIYNDENNARPLSDKEQRNIALSKIKEINSNNGWMYIHDGDEVYESNTFSLIKKFAIPSLEKNNKKIRYFASRTFVNDFYHFCWQQFPRLFKIEKDCKFINDNQMWYNQENQNTILIDRPMDNPSLDKIKYFHYSFLKGQKKFEDKRNWWMNRGLGKNFDYGWKIDKDGKIFDPTNINHKLLLYTGKHPEIMKNHPLWLEKNLNG